MAISAPSWPCESHPLVANDHANPCQVYSKDCVLLAPELECAAHRHGMLLSFHVSISSSSAMTRLIRLRMMLLMSEIVHPLQKHTLLHTCRRKIEQAGSC